jgi:hypothetical protein
MTDRDHFAAAALTGLLAAGCDIDDEAAERALWIADSMLRERDRTVDPGPAADGIGWPTSGPGSMPTDWRSDIRPPDALDRHAAAKTDAAWGVGTDEIVTEHLPKEKQAEVSEQEPVAWAVWSPAFGYQFGDAAIFKRNELAIEMCVTNGYGVDDIVPLYRTPQPTLTDEERVAILNAADSWPVVSAEHCATLRALLERTRKAV